MIINSNILRFTINCSSQSSRTGDTVFSWRRFTLNRRVKRVRDSINQVGVWLYDEIQTLDVKFVWHSTFAKGTGQISSGTPSCCIYAAAKKSVVRPFAKHCSLGRCGIQSAGL